MGNRVLRKIIFLQEVLGLDQYLVRIVHYDPMHAMDVDTGEIGVNFVGGIISGNEAIILKSRGLREEDIVHELVHFRFPELNNNHEEVNAMTSELMLSRDAMYVGGARERL